MGDELKACPFCGGTAAPWEQVHPTLGSWLCRCDDCGAQVPAGTSKKPLFKTSKEAVIAWNRRAPSSDGQDARRYRWIRSAAHDDIVSAAFVDICESDPATAELFDAAIDAAIAEGEKS